MTPKYQWHLSKREEILRLYQDNDMDKPVVAEVRIVERHEIPEFYKMEIVIGETRVEEFGYNEALMRAMKMLEAV